MLTVDGAVIFQPDLSARRIECVRCERRARNHRPSESVVLDCSPASSTPLRFKSSKTVQPASGVPVAEFVTEPPRFVITYAPNETLVVSPPRTVMVCTAG